ncbi:MAG TPA: hypothetical protein VGQ89_00630 [Candidatus Limnocylindrales bacterium]|jgi:hypothetical protein|nr:hypothetical protein [Candidatus Limnocylindrales bacterium]
MRQRRFLLTAIALGAIVSIGLGMALTANARQDIFNTVRAVTARFNSIEQAKKAGYERFYVCAEQPGVGTMGQHYVKFSLVGDPVIDPLHPEALVYEPRPDGTYKLVALEWVRVGPVTNPAPSVLGVPMLHVGSGNRYGIEPDGFYERHYWLYKANPLGAFADWNPRVSCRGAGDNGG